MANTDQQALEQMPDAVPVRRVFRLPWRSPIANAPGDLMDTVANAMVGAPIDTSDVVDQRAEDAADRAELAAGSAAEIAGQLAALVERLLGARTATSGGPPDHPDEVEVRVGEATPGPLARLTDAVARVVDAVAGTVYDYSGGQYGMAPLTGGDVRHERDRERKRAEPVAIIEEPVTVQEPGRSRLPLILLVLALAAAVGVGIWRRDRARELAGVAADRGRVVMRRAQEQGRVAMGQAQERARQLSQQARDAAQRRSLIAAPVITGALENTGTSGATVNPEVGTPDPGLASADAASAAGGISQPTP